MKHLFTLFSVDKVLFSKTLEASNSQSNTPIVFIDLNACQLHVLGVSYMTAFSRA